MTLPEPPCVLPEKDCGCTAGTDCERAVYMKDQKEMARIRGDLRLMINWHHVHQAHRREARDG